MCLGEKFINDIAKGEKMVYVNTSANGVGKTTMLVNILANLIYPGNNKWFDQGIFRDWKHKRRIRYMSTKEGLEETVIPMIEEWFPAGTYEAEKRGHSYNNLFKFKNHLGQEWVMDMLTYDQAPTKFESVTLGLAICDEPPPNYVISGTIMRLRTGGHFLIGATGVGENAHVIYDRFVAKDAMETIKLTEDGEEIQVPMSVSIHTTDLESACKEHGVRGFLDHDVIENMIASIPESERMPRVYGKYAHMLGLVFKQFSQRIHVVEPFNIDFDDYTVYHALDPHARINDAGLWVAVGKTGKMFVVDELWIDPKDERDLASAIKRKNALYRMNGMLIDSAAKATTKHSQEVSLLDKLIELGLDYIPAAKAPGLRKQANKRIETALNYREVGGQLELEPQIYIFSDCVNTIREISNWRYQEWMGKQADKKGLNETPMDKDDHMIECLGRILLTEPIWTEPQHVPTNIYSPDSNSYDDIYD